MSKETMPKIDLLTRLSDYLKDSEPELIRIRAGLRDIKKRVEVSESKGKPPKGVDTEKWQKFIKEWREFEEEYSNFQF